MLFRSIRQALTDTVSYLNTVNSTELPAGSPPSEQSKRTLSYNKLLLATPLPAKPAVPLATFDNPTGTPPTLPTDASISPYRVQFVFTSVSGFSRILSTSTDPDYVLTPLERLSLGDVQVRVESGGV